MPEEIVFLSFTSIVAVTSVLFGAMRLWNKHLDRKYAGKANPDTRRLAAEVEEMRDRLHVSAGLAERVADLEERLDFAERLLAENKERRLTPGDS